MNELDTNIREILPVIDEMIEKEQGWDQNARLLLLVAEAVTESSTAIMTKPTPGFDQTLEFVGGRGGDMQDVLFTFVKILKDVPKVIRVGAFPHKNNIAGLLFVTEAWKLEVPTPDGLNKELRTKLDEVAKEHKIHEHPDKIEARFMHVVTTRGSMITYSHERESGKTRYEDDTIGVRKVTGEVPKLLKKVLKEVLS